MFKTGKVRLRLQWRIQDTGDARAVGCSLKAMAGTDWDQSMRDDTRANNREKSRIPKSIRAQMMPPAAPDVGHEATGFAVCPVGFCFCFSQSFPDVAPFFPFEIRMVTMWYI